MRLKQAFIITLLLLGMHVFIGTVFSQTKQEKRGSFSGFIENVLSNEKCIIVNEGRVFFRDGIVVDEKGKALEIKLLKEGGYVTVHGFQRANGFFATKIVSIETPNVPRSKIKRAKESLERRDRR